MALFDGNKFSQPAPLTNKVYLVCLISMSYGFMLVYVLDYL